MAIIGLAAALLLDELARLDAGQPAERRRVGLDDGDREVGLDRAIVGDDLDPHVVRPLQRRHRPLRADGRNDDRIDLARRVGVNKGDLLVERISAVAGSDIGAILRRLRLHARLGELEELVVLEHDAGDLSLNRRLRARRRASLRRGGRVLAAGQGEEGEEGEYAAVPWS